MKAYEITFSPTGGTKKVTDLILSSFHGEKEEISVLPKDRDYTRYSFEPDDICFISVPSYGGRVPATAVKRIQCMKGNAAKAVLICVYGNRAYDDTLLELKNVVQQAGFSPIAAVAAVAEHSMLRQFATGRPDVNDTVELYDFAHRLWKKIAATDTVSEITVPGHEPYRDYGGVPFKPEATASCNECGICAKECPVGAIDLQQLRITDAEKCISCMRCIAVCPIHARKLNETMMAATAIKMAAVLETRKTNEFFL
jgi:ferredoxin/flavodoxin